MFNSLNTYNDSLERAFEALCNQLFERWLKKEYNGHLKYFTTVNGAGGDGGLEAYAINDANEIIGVQAKWFTTSLTHQQVGQIKNSILTAKKVRSKLKRYVVCLPRDFQSDKIGRGKELVEDCEEKRINALVDVMSTTYPDLALEFWNEHRIREELQKPGNEGILRFWFQKEEISIDYLKQRFNLSKEGWLREKYTPYLHSQGKIHELTEELLYTPEYREQQKTEIFNLIKDTQLTCHLIDEFNQLAGKGNEFQNDLLNIKENLNNYLIQLDNFREAIEKGANLIAYTNLTEVQIWPIKSAIETRTFPNTFRNLLPRVIAALERTHATFLADVLKYNASICEPHNYIVLGAPGTGKTHGLAKAVENRLNQNIPSIIIRAKGTPCDGWASILHNCLGGLIHWSEAEIFSALESLAIRVDILRATSDEFINEPTRILICVDGIDEAEDISTWKIRINELRQWITDFPRLRFITSSRSYVPSNMNPCNLDFDTLNKRFDLPLDGDTPLSELVPKYLKEFNIVFDNTLWILDAFENALSLKLFCEEYKGKDLSKLGKPVTLGLSALLNAKIQRIEQEFFDKSSPGWSKTDQVIKKTLFHIAESLQSKSSVKHDELCLHITQKFDGIIDRIWAAKLLDTFTEHGILLRTETTPEDGISPSEVDYSVSFQSYLDYFISIRGTQDVLNSNDKKFPSLLQGAEWNTVRLTAISLFNDHNILIGRDGYWVEDLDESDIQQLQFEALNRSTDDKIRSFIPELKSRFFQSIDHRNLILKYFVLPNLYRKELKLGLEFIHDLLISFPNTFERDLKWSSPDKFNNAGRSANIGQILSEYFLFDFHLYSDLPLIFAWSLTSVNNVYREHCRKQLTEWAIKNIEGYIKILELVFNCKDPQVQEDLATIMLGIASLINKSGTGLAALAAWVERNIFDEDRIIIHKNAVIRHCSRAVVERAYSLGECSKTSLDKAQPPYFNNGELLNLDFTGAKGREGERFPIVHDLAWYVIGKSYDDFLEYRSGRQTHKEGELLLQKYRDVYNEDFGPGEFAMSAGIAFIKGLGWDRSDGPGFTEESHGSKSKLATFEEKYTWLAVSEIQGYLADLLPFKNNNGEKLLDYNRMLHTSNPAKGLILEGAFNRKIKFIDRWYLPEDISPALNFTESTLAEDIKNWVNRKDEPEFSLWINVHNLSLNKEIHTLNDWTTLYMDSSFSEPNKIGSTSLQIICCLIEMEKFNSFIECFKKNCSDIKRWYFNDLDHFESSPKSDTYTSVKDVVWMNWMEEEYSTADIECNEYETFYLQKTVCKVTENSLDDGERTFKIPSKLLREKIGIVNANEECFYDSNEELKAIYRTTGDTYRDSQEYLIIDKVDFIKFLERNKLKPFWLGFQFQTTTLEQKQKRENNHAQNCRFWLIWEEDGKLKRYPYHDGYFTDDRETN